MRTSDAVAHLARDERSPAGRATSVDLDAAVHRTGMHDDRVLLEEPRPRARVSPKRPWYSSSDGSSASPIRSAWIRSR